MIWNGVNFGVSMESTAALGDYNGLLYAFFVFILKIQDDLNYKIAIQANIYNLIWVI